MGEKLAWIWQVLMQAGLWTVICGCIMAHAFDDRKIFLVVFLTCIIGTAYWIAVGYRLFKAQELTDAQLERTLHVSFFVRWSVLVGGLVIAGMRSASEFKAVAVALLGMFALMMVDLIRHAYHIHASKKKL